MGIFSKLFGKKAEKETSNPESLNIDDLWYSLPTISDEFPQITASANNSEFDIYIHEDDYRQNEFLKPSSLPLIEQEITSIRNIWENCSKKSDDYTLFKDCYPRSIIGEPNLEIKFSELKKLLNIDSVGTVKINDGTLIDSFAFKTDNTTFYGTAANEKITQLCIAEWNENTINEIVNINKTFDLVFINWFHCDLIKENA